MLTRSIDHGFSHKCDAIVRPLGVLITMSSKLLWAYMPPLLIGQAIYDTCVVS